MEIQEGKNQLYIGDESDPKAHVTFEDVDADTIEVTHTEVTEAMQGEGTGGKLIQAIADYARKNNQKIVASCPYANHKLQKGEFKDVYKGEA